MRIDSSGRVGIGTSSPAYELDVKSSGEADIRIDSATGNDGALRFAENGTNVFTMYHDAANSALAFYDNANTSERMRIDSSGNVGIGTSSVDTKLHLEESDTTSVFLKTQNSAGALLVGNNSSGNSYVSAQTSGKPLILETENTERMRIDSSGNLLVGGTSPEALGSTTITQAGQLISRVDNAYAVEFRRDNGDGDIAVFRKDGTTVGSIGVSGVDFIIDSSVTDSAIAFQWDDGGTTRKLQGYQTAFRMNTANDAAVDLGSSGARFKDLYLSGGVYLGGTGAANKLDDYEEGTFTPTSPDVTLTSPYSTSRYRKIGSLVYVTYDFVVPVTSATQFLKVNTPFAAVNYGSGSLGWTDSSTDLLVHVNTSGVSFRKNDGSGDYRYADLSGKRFIFTVLFTTTA
jgi:hypothetical protein